MHLIVKNRREAESSNNVAVPHIIISFFTPGDEPPRLATNPHTQNTIQFAFDDLDSEDIMPATRAALGNPVLFGDGEAATIARTVKHARGNGVDCVICHCDAGVSRSAGVAAALANYYNDDDSVYFNAPKGIYVGSDRMYRPNMLVYRKVLEALQEL